MSVFGHWTPTIAATLILVVAAFLLEVSIRRDERRKRESRSRSRGHEPVH